MRARAWSPLGATAREVLSFNDRGPARLRQPFGKPAIGVIARGGHWSNNRMWIPGRRASFPRDC